MRRETKRLNAEIERLRGEYGHVLQELPPERWPNGLRDSVAFPPARVWVSCRHTAMLFPDGRLSFSIARVGDDGRFLDGMDWDELNRLKSEAGFGDRWAVECFPPKDEIVNVSNMRHLWLLDAPPVFGWVNGGPSA